MLVTAPFVILLIGLVKVGGSNITNELESDL